MHRKEGEVSSLKYRRTRADNTHIRKHIQCAITFSSIGLYCQRVIGSTTFYWVKPGPFLSKSILCSPNTCSPIASHCTDSLYYCSDRKSPNTKHFSGRKQGWKLWSTQQMITYLKVFPKSITFYTKVATVLTDGSKIHDSSCLLCFHFIVSFCHSLRLHNVKLKALTVEHGLNQRGLL